MARMVEWHLGHMEMMIVVGGLWFAYLQHDSMSKSLLLGVV